MKQSDRLMGIVLVIVAGAFFLDASQLRNVGTNDLIGPKAYPQVLAIVLAGLAVILILGGKQGADKSIGWAGVSRRFLPMVLFSAIYVVVLPLIGFLIATAALLLACFYLLGQRKHWLNLVLAISCTVGIYLLFARVLGVSLSAFPGL